MIYVNIPYCPKEKGQDLGMAYNSFMEIIGEDDWACFLDHDAMFTTNNWYHQLEDIIEKHSDVGLFTCVMNRVGNPMQKIVGIDENNHDVAFHRRIGKSFQEKYYTDVRVESKLNGWLVSGVLILLSKKAWKKSGGFKSGFLSVDNDIHQKCIKNNIKVGIMNGVYVYHWYTADGNVSHLK